MRRRGSRESSGKSSDPPNKYNSRSSTLRYPSRSNKNKEPALEEPQQDSQEETNSISEKNVFDTKQGENVNENHTKCADNSAGEFSQQVEDVEESEKGKSNDIVKSNVEQSRDIIEPQIENENVQGTAQSPSKDYDENVQNVNDLQTKLEESEDNQQTTELNNEETVQQNDGANFESEYMQGTETDNDNVMSNRDNSVQGLQSLVEKSTPEPVDNKLNKSVNSENRDSKPTTERKKITLRRSSPIKERRSSTQETGEKQKKERRFSIQESNEKEIKDNAVKSKKIVLKRPTIDEKTSSIESKGNEGAKQSSVSEDEHDRKRKISTSADERTQESNNGKICFITFIFFI